MGKTFKLLPHMCKLQKQEIDNLLCAADEIGAAATSAIAQGGHGYNLLVEARDNFKNKLLGMMEHTRICLEEDEEQQI